MRRIVLVLVGLAALGFAREARASVRDVTAAAWPSAVREVPLDLLEGPVAVERTWDPVAFRDQLIRLLPSRALEELAQSFAERNVQVDLREDRAFVVVRIPL